MAIHWRLKTYLATHHCIYSAVDFQKKITKNTGIIISAQNLRTYLNETPKSIPLKTLQLLCTALQCELSDLLQIKPKPPLEGKIEPKKLSFFNTPINKRSKGQLFPDPTRYESGS